MTTSDFSFDIEMVATRKALWNATPLPAAVDPAAWHTRYRDALTRSAKAFDEDESRE